MRAILEADADDHDARLVYADFLQQRGDPRGELVAMQIRAAREMTDELWRAERALLDDHEKQWLGPWYGVARQWNFRLGFLHDLEVRLDAFVEMAAIIHAVEPLSDHLMHVRSLHLLPSESGSYEAELDKLGELASAIPLRIETLTIEHELDHAAAARYAAAPMLATVKTLRLKEVARGWQSFDLLWASPQLRRLETLVFVEASMTAPEALALSRAPLYSQVRRLEIVDRDERTTWAPVDDTLRTAGAVALVAANPRLTRLRFEGLRIFDEVVVELGRRKPPLVELCLADNYVKSANGLENLRTLKRLDVRRTELTNDAVHTILSLPALEALNLERTLITAWGVDQILHRAPASLRELTVSVPELDPSVVSALSRRFKLHRWR